MIKKDTGITLISLSIAVIIILTITGMILYSAKDNIYIKNLTNMQNDIANLRDKISLYYSEYEKIPVKTEYVETSNLETAGVIGANDTGKFYIIELENLEGLTLNYGEDYETYKANGYTYSSDLTDIYIINEDSHNIFYVEGIRVTENGTTQMYYTDYTQGDQEMVDLKEIENWHEETNETGETIITNGIAQLKIGDYIDYHPQKGADKTSYLSSKNKTGHTEDQIFNLASYAYGWRVLGVDEKTNEILLIAEDFIGPDSGGQEANGRTYYYLIGQTGYANGIEELNTISQLYGQGKGASGARSVTVEDVNKIVGYDPETANWGTGESHAYGNQVTYSSAGFTYFDEESKTWKTLENGESVTLMNNYYSYGNNYTLLFANSVNSAIEDTYKGSQIGCQYWLASPYLVTYNESSISWGLHSVIRGSINIGHANDSSMLIGTSSYGRNRYRGVRPVISLDADIAILQQEGTSDNPHQIQ